MFSSPQHSSLHPTLIRSSSLRSPQSLQNVILPSESKGDTEIPIIQPLPNVAVKPKQERKETDVYEFSSLAQALLQLTEQTTDLTPSLSKPTSSHKHFPSQSYPPLPKQHSNATSPKHSLQKPQLHQRTKSNVDGLTLLQTAVSQWKQQGETKENKRDDEEEKKETRQKTPLSTHKHRTPNQPTSTSFLSPAFTPNTSFLNFSTPTPVKHFPSTISPITSLHTSALHHSQLISPHKFTAPSNEDSDETSEDESETSSDNNENVDTTHNSSFRSNFNRSFDRSFNESNAVVEPNTEEKKQLVVPVQRRKIRVSCSVTVIVPVLFRIAGLSNYLVVLCFRVLVSFLHFTINLLIFNNNMNNKQHKNLNNNYNNWKTHSY